MSENVTEYDVDGPPVVDENEPELSEDELAGTETFPVFAPEDEPEPDSWTEPDIQIPWWEKAIDATFNFFRKITGR